jgi:hypothetical protein
MPNESYKADVKRNGGPNQRTMMRQLGPVKRALGSHLALTIVAVATLVIATPRRGLSQSANSPWPSIRESKAIAEQGFIYGLPIVMNYAVMYQYVIDRVSGQWKAPFNAISNEHRVFTYKDTTIVTPNSDTPYSLAWMDLRAEPIVLSVPTIEKSRYYAVQLIDSNTFNFGYIGSRSTGNNAGE